MELRSPLYLGVVAIEKGALRAPSTKVAFFTLFVNEYFVGDIFKQAWAHLFCSLSNGFEYNNFFFVQG